MPRPAVLRTVPGGFEYVRVFLGSHRDEPGITLYEVDGAGRVHRMVEIRATGSRFAPEDVLMLGAVDPTAMVRHPAGERFDREPFEALWNEVRVERPFRALLPEADSPWEGTLAFGPAGSLTLRWLPGTADAGCGWCRVRGFDELFVYGGRKEAERAYRALFFEPVVSWEPLAHRAA